MKIHIVGGFFTTSGYSSALRGFTRGLIENGIDVTITDIVFKNDKPLPENENVDDLKALLTNEPKEADIFLSWSVPDALDVIYQIYRLGKFKEWHHMFSWECYPMPRIWNYYLEKYKIDRIITPSIASKFRISWSLSENDRLKDKIDVVPHGYDPKFIYKKDLENDTFDVLFVGTWIKRKAPLETVLVTCIALAGTNSRLILKLPHDDAQLRSIKRNIQSTLVKFKDKIKGKLPKILIINDNYSSEQMNDLYNSADIMISLSRGEAFNIPIFNACVLEKPVIIADSTSVGDFIDTKNYRYSTPTKSLILCDDNQGYYRPEFGLKWADVQFFETIPLLHELYNLYKYDKEKFDLIGKQLNKDVINMTNKNVAKLYINQIMSRKFDKKEKFMDLHEMVNFFKELKQQ